VPSHRIGTARVACALLVAGALAVPSAAFAGQEQRVPAPPAAGAVPGRVIVVWEPGTDRGDRLAARDDADAAFVRTLGDARFQLLRPQPGQSVADALTALRDDPSVQVAERDTFDVLHATSNDPLLGQQWGLQNVGVPIDGAPAALPGADVDALAAWDRTRGSASTVIADLDSGYQFDHPDLGPVAWTNPADPANGVDDDGNGIVDDTHGADFVGDNADAPAIDGDPTDDDLIGHGVHTAGTMGAAGNNGVGVSGVAQDVRIMPLRVCSFSVTFLQTLCPSSSQIAAINYAGAHGARAANMSLGGLSSSPAIQAALTANAQVLFVVSAGNGGRDGIGDDNDAVPTYPCAYPLDNIVCVAATTQADQLAGFSNFGATTVDVGAPGTEILSTFPVLDTFEDHFTANDFASRWTATGRDGGFARTSEAPLTSFGISDSPGVAPVARSVRASTSVGVALPAGVRSCELDQSRTLSGDGRFDYAVLLNGRVVDGLSNARPGSGDVSFDVDDAAVAGGGTLQLAFTYTADNAPRSTDGVWLDNIAFTCEFPTYDFLDGTSMAAPHVTGAAGLLFSLNPSASVAQVRAALLATVHPVAALAGKTVSGGRIDAAAALDEIRQPDTRIASAPSSVVRSRRATFAFARSDAPLPASFECQLDGAAFAACTSPVTFVVRGGRHTLAVRAKSPRGIVVDATPATATWTVLQCKVPKLTGKSLSRARWALRRAHCALGAVRRPRALRRAHGLVVRSSRPRAGELRGFGAAVAVKLGRPIPRRPRHRRHRRGR
jgi:subtilisin family serine protease